MLRQKPEIDYLVEQKMLFLAAIGLRAFSEKNRLSICWSVIVGQCWADSTRRYNDFYN